MKKNNIALVGMPGCGKSTIGVLLAKAINYNFCDTDLLIQTDQEMKLQEIIQTYGNERFREIEDNVISSINCKKTVLATGGSVIYGEKGMEHLKEISTVVYIKLSCEEVIGRIKNIKTRGISMDKGETLEDLYKERCPLYEKYADIILDLNGYTIEECVSMIMDSYINNN